MSRQERLEAPEQHMCKDLPGDGEKRYRSVGGAISFGPFAFMTFGPCYDSTVLSYILHSVCKI